MISHVWNNYLIHVVDILLVSYIFYKLLLLIKDTRALQVLLGIVVLAIVTVLTREVIHLKTLGWILEKFWVPAVVIIAIIFQPELRSALAQLGSRPIGRVFVTTTTGFIREVIPAVADLSLKKFGALIVLEQETGLQNFVETGTVIHGEVTRELLLSIFYPNSILHDGAVIIQGSRIVAAGCILPVSDYPLLPKELGTRHRGAIGVSEVSDAIVIVVSEETGSISLVSGGQIQHNIGLEELEKCLVKYCHVKIAKGVFHRGRKSDAR